MRLGGAGGEGRLGGHRVGEAGEEAGRGWRGRWGDWKLGGGRLGEAGILEEASESGEEADAGGSARA